MTLRVEERPAPPPGETGAHAGIVLTGINVGDIIVEVDDIR